MADEDEPLGILRELIAGADDHRCWYIPAEILTRARTAVDAVDQAPDARHGRSHDAAISVWCGFHEDDTLKCLHHFADGSAETWELCGSGLGEPTRLLTRDWRPTGVPQCECHRCLAQADVLGD